MLKNYLKIAFRNIIRSKLYSFINIAGLSVGIACFALIISYIYFEMNYDGFHKDARNIYRIYSGDRSQNGESFSAETPDPLPKTLLNDYPGMFEVARLFRREFWVTRGNKAFSEIVYGSDQSFFKVFDFKLLEGSRDAALSNPNSVVLTEKFARKIFGYTDPLGKSIKINNYDFTVTGILQNFPNNSSIKFNVLFPAKIREYFDPGYDKKWYSSGTFTCIRFTGKKTPAELRNQLPLNIKKYMPDYLQKRTSLYLQPFTQTHLSAGIDDNIVAPVSVNFLYTLLAIAISILMISCVNFMNISTSRHTERLKEIGMRKVLGANRKQLIRQFISESVLMSFMSLIIGIGLAELFLKQFGNLTGEQINLYPLFAYPNIFVAIGFGLIVGLLSGSWPAFFLSSRLPVHIFAGRSGNNKKSNMRNVLVVGQFVIAAVLIATVLLIKRQINFMEKYDLGFQPNNVLTIPIETEVDRGRMKDVKALMDLINENKVVDGIKSLCLTENVPGYYFNNRFGVIPENGDVNKPLEMVVTSIDENFIKTYGAKIIRGRNFSLSHISDKTGAVILNESAARKLGWTDAVGKRIRYIQDNYSLTVIGVMKDINISSLQNTVQPMVFRYTGADYEKHFVSLRLDPTNVSGEIKILKNEWKSVFPDSPFSYFFVSDKYYESYKSERNLAEIIIVFSSLAVLLACLGLFGLASLKVTQRTKEIGVRKVLGATVNNIIGMLTKEFLLMILAADLLSVPLSYIIMNRWLQEFAYRTYIGINIFVITTAVTLLIAFLTLSGQAVKAATANPVKSLRYE